MSNYDRSFVDWAGKTTENGLSVLRLVRRTPPAWAIKCVKCGTETTEPHSRIRYAECRNATCGKPARKRDRLDEERARARERERRALEEKVSEADRRMSEETAEYERPTKYAPTTPGPLEMTQRERDSLREFKAAEEAAQREADAPRIEAERQAAERIAQLREEQEETLRQLRALERERVLNLPDEEFQVDPATIGIVGVTPANVDSWHGAQSTQFLADNPSYFRCPENESAIISYVQRNAPNLVLLSAKQMTDAYRRLRDLGLLKERPAPVVTPTPEPVEHRTEPKPAPQPTNPLGAVVDGWEIDGSSPRQWTARELERLSADDYRRAMRLYKADLELPNVGPGPSLRTR